MFAPFLHDAPGPGDLPVTLKISKRARRLALRLDPGAMAVTLVVPERASLRKAYQFARQHEGWIRARLAALPRPVAFTDGAVLPVLGRERRIRVERDDTARRTRIVLAEDELRVLTNLDDPAPRIARFLKSEAEQAVGTLVREKCARIGKKTGQISIRDTKSRWGSCAPDGRMSFSWRLVLAPPAAMDYVCAHETAHLVHMNHGSRFWALCAELSTDYSTGRDWMRRHGHELLRYGAAETISSP